MMINKNELPQLLTVLTVNFENAKTLFTHPHMSGGLFSSIAVKFHLKSNNNILLRVKKTRLQD